MSDYEFFCHACSKPFSRTLTPGEYEEGSVICPHCGSKEVEQRWFYAATAKQDA